ncbi:hypothetical protein BDW02DRAFT_499695 [Decorospora gaudefroyi]|uniref:Uncharacterized protein n=1 Tax=Decorospora gaudefroyi TaxID=184978 RepID=A0A6A5K7R7_9PLEO|nr:hypothetical protein BDW02DRAFT_499695 [Decorospora gaudefroyi]
MKARAQETVFKALFRCWLELHRRLFLLKQCQRYAFFANNSLQLNALVLHDLRCKPLRECLQEVLGLQRGMAKFAKKMKAAVKEEKRQDDEFWRLKA